MAEGKAATEINFLRVQTIDDRVTQEIFSANLSEGLIKVNDDGLFDTEYAERFDLLIERLQKRRRGFRMQHRAWMRLESNHGRHGADSARSLDHRLHDQLMTKMQTVEHAECQNRRAGDIGVVGTVKESHETKAKGKSKKVKVRRKNPSPGLILAFLLLPFSFSSLLVTHKQPIVRPLNAVRQQRRITRMLHVMCDVREVSPLRLQLFHIFQRAFEPQMRRVWTNPQTIQHQHFQIA